MRPEPGTGPGDQSQGDQDQRHLVPTMYRVVSRVEEMSNTVTLDLEPVAAPLPAGPTPGQFNMLWAFGIGEAPISLARSSRATHPERLTHTIRRVGAVTNALCDTDVGGLIGVRGPYGTGWNLPAAVGRDVMVIAGGLGVAPVRPLVEEILGNRDSYGRLAVLIGARSPDDLLYRPLLEQWRGRLDIELEVTVDRAPAEWRGDVGLVTRLIPRAPVDLARAAVFVCGPEIMMRFVAQEIVDRGAPPGNLQLSLERNMHCAIGHCGHCQLGPAFVCKDGPVLTWKTVEPLLAVPAR